MQTTLRIDDRLYREAKAEAARQGITLTRFIEEALRLRLDQPLKAASTPVSLPTYASDAGFDLSPEALKRLANDSQTDHDLGKLT